MLDVEDVVLAIRLNNGITPAHLLKYTAKRETNSHSQKFAPGSHLAVLSKISESDF